MTSFVEKREEDIPHMHPCVSSSPKDSIMDFPLLIGHIWNQKSDTFAEIVKSGGHIRYVKMATTEGRLSASCQGSLVNLINRKGKKVIFHCLACSFWVLWIFYMVFLKSSCIMRWDFHRKIIPKRQFCPFNYFFSRTFTSKTWICALEPVFLIALKHHGLLKILMFLYAAR